MNALLVAKSANQKTGPIPVTYSSEKTCPDSCPLKGAGCYGDDFRVQLHARKVTRGVICKPWAEFVAAIRALPAGQIWRHNVKGDLPGTGDRINRRMLKSLALANRGKGGFTYTHKPTTRRNLAAIFEAVRLGFTINLSANGLKDADKKARHGLPVATIVPEGSPARFKTPGGLPVVVCPAQRGDVTCSTCKLCGKADRRFIVGFLPHGARKGVVASLASKS